MAKVKLNDDKEMSKTEVIERIASRLGHNTNTVRAAIVQGKYPFATAFKLEPDKPYVYTVFPEKAKEYLGEDIFS